MVSGAEALGACKGPFGTTWLCSPRFESAPMFFPRRTHDSEAGVRGVMVALAGPIFGLVAVVAAGGFLLLWDIARDQDRAFIATTRALVESAIDGVRKATATSVMDFAVWNDAYDNVTVRWNDKWVRKNIYSSVVDGVSIIRPDHSVRYSWISEDYSGLAAKLTSAVAESAFDAAGFNRLAQADEKPSMSMVALTEVDGRLAVAAAAPVSREDAGERARAGRPTDFMAAITVLDQAAIGRMGESLGLQDLALVPNAAMPAADPAIVATPVLGRNGQPVGWFVWRNMRPGTTAFERRTLPIAVGLLLAGLLALGVTREVAAAQMRAISAANAAQEASRLKSQFLATMSHELRTPLNAIIGYSEIIEEESEDSADRSILEDSRRVQRAARHLLELINDVLDLSKIEAGKVELQATPSQLAPILDEVVDAMRQAAAKNGNELIVHCPPGIGSATIDPLRFKQCLLNLVSNAVKFTRNGRVTITMSEGLEAEGSIVRIEVADTGIGISEQVLSRLFQPFVQADDSVTREYGGTGLGLAITKRLVEAMGGSMQVSSRLGAGSTFTMQVPRNPGSVLDPALDQAA